MAPGGQLQGDIPLAQVSPTGGGGVALSLTFTGGHDGLLGNWDLAGLSTIERDRRGGIRYADTDGFTATAGGHLVASGSDYRAENDGGIIFRKGDTCGSGPCTWTAILPDGSKMIYGENDSSRVKGPVGVPNGSSSVLVWHLSRVVDRNGNSATISYGSVDGWRYPARIDYSQNDGASLAPRSIEFAYDDNPVSIPAYEAGVRVDARKHLRSATSTLSGSDVFSYQFQYAADFRTGMLRLTDVVQKIRGVQHHTPLSIRYRAAVDVPSATAKTVDQDPGAGMVDPAACKDAAFWCNLTYYAGSIPSPAREIIGLVCLSKTTTINKCKVGNTWGAADLNGDGRIDFSAVLNDQHNSGRKGIDLATGAQIFTSLNTSNGEWGTSYLLDVNGDGRDDLLSLRQTQEWTVTKFGFNVSINNGAGFGGETEYRPSGVMGMGYDEFAFVKALLSLWIGLKLAKIENHGKRVFEPKPSKGKIQGLSNAQTALGVEGTSDNFAQWADMDGDGLPDLVRLTTATTMSVARNTGSGFATDVDSAVDASLATAGAEGAPSASVDVAKLEKEHPEKKDCTDPTDSINADDVTCLPEADQGAYVTTSSGNASSPGGYRALADINGDGVPDYIFLVESGAAACSRRTSGRRAARFRGR